MSSPHVNTVAVCQMCSTGDKKNNLETVSTLVCKAAKDGARMIFLPEACDFITDQPQDIYRLSEEICGGPTIRAYQQLAIDNNVWLSIGSIHEKGALQKVYNTHVIINEHGEIVQTYRKLHLFDLSVPEQNLHYKESEYCHKGENIVTPVETNVGKVGMAICYDLRFQEMSTQLRILGADILTYPSAFTYTTGEAHWETLLRARAIDNQCYVIAAAQVHSHNIKRRSYGHAMIIDPWGVVIANCKEDCPTYQTANVDLDIVSKIRRIMPLWEHRRRDMYSEYAFKLRDKLPLEHQPDKATDTSKLVMNQTIATNYYAFGEAKIPKACIFMRDYYMMAFVNIRCVVPGHVLVAPIRKVRRLQELNEDESLQFIKSIRNVQKTVEYAYKCKSSTLTIQDGPDAGQTIEHLHCHIMPRKSNDFIPNDLIYLELAKHYIPDKPVRCYEEMVEEAKFMKSAYDKVMSLAK